MKKLTEREKRRIERKQKARARRWSDRIAVAFKHGSTREECAEEFGTTVANVDAALRAALRRS